MLKLDDGMLKVIIAVYFISQIFPLGQWFSIYGAHTTGGTIQWHRRM